LIQPTYNAFDQPKAENRLKERRQACTTFALISSGAELTARLLRQLNVLTADHQFAAQWPPQVAARTALRP